MLNDEVIEKVSERLVNRIEQGNVYIMKKIGESIKKIGTLSPSDAQLLVQTLKYGGSYEDMVAELSKITNMNVADIQEIFKEVAKNDHDFAKQFYDYKGIDYVPFDNNIALQSQISALAKMTAEKYINITNTSALGFSVTDLDGNLIHKGLQQTYYDLLDTAVLNVAQGKETFGDAMYRILKEVGTSGLKTVDYESGRSMRLDSAVRMNLKSGLRTLHNETQQQFGAEFGADGVEISVHYNPADDHAEVQGRQFSNTEYLKLQTTGEAKDYTGKTINITRPRKKGGSTFRPISQYNCYHYVFSIVLGASEPEYTDSQLNEIRIKNDNGFYLYDDKLDDYKHYTNYQGTQLQRKLETQIRKWKDTQILANESGNDRLVGEAQQKITELTREYSQLSRVSGLKTKMQRMRVSGYKRRKVRENLINRNNDFDFSNIRKKIDDTKWQDMNSDEMQNIYLKSFNKIDNYFNTFSNKEIEDTYFKFSEWAKEGKYRSENPSHPIGDFLNKKLNYDKKPELIQKSEFFKDEDGNFEDNFSLLPPNRIYRGINNIFGESSKYIEEFKTGKFFSGSGYDANGTFFSPSYSIAMEYADKNENGIIFGIIKNNAKKTSLVKMEIARNYILDNFTQKYALSEGTNKYRLFYNILSDPGYIASLLGYDVIGMDTSRILILNRGILKVVK